jgi:hypothetical protein
MSVDPPCPCPQPPSSLPYLPIALHMWPPLPPSWPPPTQGTMCAPHAATSSPCSPTPSARSSEPLTSSFSSWPLHYPSAPYTTARDRLLEIEASRPGALELLPNAGPMEQGRHIYLLLGVDSATEQGGCMFFSP